MHWTALLAYRRHPENAMVGGDLFCLGCGYNLRGLRLRGNCPECGRNIEDSLVLLEQPSRVAGALATIGKSYLGLFAVGLLFLVTRTGGTSMLGWLMMLIFASTVLLRCIGALELRFLAGLQHRPQVTGRVTFLFWAILLEFVATMALLVTWAFGSTGLLEAVSLAWAITTLASVVAAGRSGIGLAKLLEYESIARELWVQQILLLAALVLGALAVLLRISFAALPASGNTGATAMIALVAGCAALTGIAAIFVTFTGLLRLSMAAHSEVEPLDHLITTDPAFAPPPPPPPRGQEPEVPLERGRPTPNPRAE